MFKGHFTRPFLTHLISWGTSGTKWSERQPSTECSNLHLIWPVLLLIPNIFHIRRFYVAPSHVKKSTKRPLFSARIVASVKTRASKSPFTFPRVANVPITWLHLPANGTKSITIPWSDCTLLSALMVVTQVNKSFDVPSTFHAQVLRELQLIYEWPTNAA